MQNSYLLNPGSKVFAVEYGAYDILYKTETELEISSPYCITFPISTRHFPYKNYKLIMFISGPHSGKLGFMQKEVPDESKHTS